MCVHTGIGKIYKTKICLFIRNHNLVTERKKCVRLSEKNNYLAAFIETKLERVGIFGTNLESNWQELL